MGFIGVMAPQALSKAAADTVASRKRGLIDMVFSKKV
jgi:hypothetical protein